MIEAALTSGELELGGLLEPVDPGTFERLPMVRAPLWLVAPRESRWEDHATVPLADLARESFVFYAESLALHDAVLDACRQAGFTPSIVSRSGHWDFMAALVHAGSASRCCPSRIAGGSTRASSRAGRSSSPRSRGRSRSAG